jgi:hypothetical protein
LARQEEEKRRKEEEARKKREAEKQAQEKAERKRREQDRQRKGHQATLLTGAGGLDEPAPVGRTNLAGDQNGQTRLKDTLG